MSELRTWNNLGVRALIKVGQRIRVAKPVEKSADARGTTSKNSSRTSKAFEEIAARAKKSTSKSASNSGRSSNKTATRTKRDQKVVHVVRKGENLTEIAKRYDVTVAHLAQQNDLKKKSLLYVGKKLVIRD